MRTTRHPGGLGPIIGPRGPFLIGSVCRFAPGVCLTAREDTSASRSCSPLRAWNSPDPGTDTRQGGRMHTTRVVALLAAFSCAPDAAQENAASNATTRVVCMRPPWRVSVPGSGEFHARSGEDEREAEVSSRAVRQTPGAKRHTDPIRNGPRGPMIGPNPPGWRVVRMLHVRGDGTQYAVRTMLPVDV